MKKPLSPAEVEMFQQALNHYAKHVRIDPFTVRKTHKRKRKAHVAFGLAQWLKRLAGGEV